MSIKTVPNRPRRLRYAANAGQTVFPFNFPIFLDSDLDVRRFRNDVETVLVLGGDYEVQGAGAQDGGTVTLRAPAAAGDLIVIRSAQPHERATIYTNGGPLLAESLLAEFNRHTIGQQQLRQDSTQSLRLPASDPTDLAELPGRLARRNALLAFGSAGEVQLIPRGTENGGAYQQLGAGAVVRTVQDELALRIHPRQFGGAGDGSQDDTLPVQRAADVAGELGGMLDLDGDWLVSNTILVPASAAGVRQTGPLIYAGPEGTAALVIGEGGGVRCQAKTYTGLRVVRSSLASWTNEGDIGLVLRNIDACQVEVVRVEGFMVGVQLRGEAAGCEDCTITLGRLVNNRFGLDVHCTEAGSWANSIRYIGGHFANSLATHPTLSRYGVRFAAAPGAYDRHNAHHFYGPAFELQRQGTPGTVEAIPFLIEVGDARGIHGHDIRMEGCSPTVTKVTGQASDCSFSVSYTGTYGWKGNQVAYAAGVKRNGVTVFPRHLAESAIGATRLFADASSVRALAYRDNSISASGQGYTGAIGFERLAVLSGNPSGDPTTLNTRLFPALTLLTLTNDAVQLNSARAICFVVDVQECKEVVLAADGSKLRLVVQQYDAAENLLGQESPITLSGANVLWSPGRDAEQHVVEGIGTSRWWEMNVNLDEPLVINFNGSPVETVPGVNQHQRIRLHDNAAFAAIGVRGGEDGALLRALRLYCAPVHSPAILYGGGRRWGQRERSALLDVPAFTIPVSGTVPYTVPLPGVRHGDMVQASFTQTTGYEGNSGLVTTTAAVSAPDTVAVRMTSHHDQPIDFDAGTLYVQAVKPRL